MRQMAQRRHPVGRLSVYESCYLLQPDADFFAKERNPDAPQGWKNYGMDDYLKRVLFGSVLINGK